MEILEAYDLTRSFRAAAGLVGCNHKTVAYWVRQRDEAGGMPVVERSRPAMEAASKRSGTSRSTKAAPSRGTPPRPSRNCCAATASTTASTKRSAS